MIIKALDKFRNAMETLRQEYVEVENISPLDFILAERMVELWRQKEYNPIVSYSKGYNYDGYQTIWIKFIDGTDIKLTDYR